MSGIVYYKSDYAATFVTGISGWVDRYGSFFGDDEHAARYSGCTHVNCGECNKYTQKASKYCDSCQELRDIEKYERREKLQWDKKTPIFSWSKDKFFYTEDDILDYVYLKRCTIKSLRLVICDPVTMRQLSADDWCIDEVPDSVADALESLNTAISEADPVSWSPGKYAADVEYET